MMKFKAFTLAELLIALAILGVIATFTIPKILTAQQDTNYKAMAKEAVSMISGADQAYKMDNAPTAVTKATDLTPYMNYVSISTVGTIDDIPNGTTLACADATPCLKLHNSGILRPHQNFSFDGTSSLNYISYTLDPDGLTTNKKDCVRFLIYFDGRVTDRGNCLAGSLTLGSTCSPAPNNNPSWFNWN